MSIFENPGQTFVFLLFRKHEFSICEHNGNNTKYVIYCYAVEEIVRNCSYDDEKICFFLGSLYNQEDCLGENENI